ncbi:MAG: DNA-processing protein DprA [Dehalococcoidales bacterium]
MNSLISTNTQAILLLATPLITGRGSPAAEILTLGEYNRLARALQDAQREPADLLGPEANDILNDLQDIIDKERLSGLLERGFLLSQALDNWQTRAIWVLSRADNEYPERIKSRLKDSAPPILYGCGDSAILDTGRLAIVGSRKVDEALREYTENVGRVAAQANETVVSGGARGIDQSAMSGVLQGGGRAIGVLADSLGRQVLSRDLREYLMESQLVLISPYDPSAGFNVGHAMQRNKVIYALADAALVVSSDYGKGGTWAGAIEQLEKLHFVPIYVRSNGDNEKGLKALQDKGALVWSDPSDSESFSEAINVQVDLVKRTNKQGKFDFQEGT